MALNKSILQVNIKNRILALEPSLISKLDGGPLSSQLTGSKSLFEAMGNINIKCKGLSAAGAFNEITVKQISSNEWANAIGRQVISLLAEDISRIISEEVDKYVRTITVIIPAGQQLFAADQSGGGVGATTTPSPAGIIS